MGAAKGSGVELSGKSGKSATSDERTRRRVKGKIGVQSGESFRSEGEWK